MTFEIQLLRGGKTVATKKKLMGDGKIVYRRLKI